MANPVAPFGALSFDSEGKEVRVRRYVKKTGNVIAPGDFVTQTATGNVDLAAAADPILGVAVEYKAAADITPIAIIDDPEAVFEVKSSGTGVVAADVFQNANIAATAYDSVLKLSKHSLDSATLGTSSIGQLKILGLSPRQNNAYGSNAVLKVKINNHVLKGGTGSVGV